MNFTAINMNSALIVLFTLLTFLAQVAHAETDSSSVYSYATVPVVGGVIVLVAMVANCMKGGSAGGNPEGSSDKKPSNNPTTNASGTSSGAASNKPESSKEPNPDSQPQGKDNYKEILDFKAAMKKRQTENP